jgi:hypothetical protein
MRVSDALSGKEGPRFAWHWLVASVPQRSMDTHSRALQIKPFKAVEKTCGYTAHYMVIRYRLVIR